jgi:hypothetical protein
MSRASENARSQETGRRRWTVDEANRSLVLVRRIAADVTEQYAALRELHETVETAQRQGRYEIARDSRNELLRQVERMQDCVEELETVGVDLEDWTLGVVHFACLADGREVLLCWQRGEQRVGHWHEVDDGCGARKPISCLPAAASELAVHEL